MNLGENTLNNSSFPVIIRGIYADWKIISWNLQQWCEYIEETSNEANQKLPFRRGKILCKTIPHWESYTEISEYSPNEFAHFSSEREWIYFDYKQFDQWFKSGVFKGKTWERVGFPNKRFEESSIWMGSKGAHTPCHADTYGSNVVLQLYGRKRWILFPPEQIEMMRSTRTPYEESSIYSSINFNCCRNFRNVNFHGAYVADLNAGDVLFVPPRWWHYVQNITTSISINTWIENENDDNWRLEEAVVKFIVSAATSEISEEMKRILLNPNEVSIDGSATCLELLKLCLEKCPSEKASFQEKMSKFEASNCEFVPKIDEVEAVLREICLCCPAMDENTPIEADVKPITRENENDISMNSSDLSVIIDAFCHPDVVSLISDKLRNKWRSESENKK